MCKYKSQFKCVFLSSVVLLAIILPGHAFSQEESSAPKLRDVISGTESEGAVQGGIKVEQKKLVKVGPSDEFDRGVPYNSVEGYFKAAKAGDFERALQYLDLRNLPRGYTRKDGAELARQLKVVLDRSLWVEMDLLSVKSEGHSDDGLKSYRDLVGQIEIKGKKYDILLQHVPRSDGVFIWKFSSRTVRDIPELYQELGYGPIGEKLSLYVPDYELLGLQIWQWIFLFLISFAALLVTMPVCRLSSWLIRRRKTEFSLMFSRFINGPLNVVLILLITRQCFYLIHPSLTAQSVFEGATVTVIAFVWLWVSALGLYREYFSAKLIKRGQDHAVMLLSPVITTLKIVVVFLGLLVWLDNIGFKVTTVLAGLGIGGIALALATQKSIENFIGALTLYLAAPVKVGDFCRFGDKMGVVEEIGLRATKIRTLDMTLLIVPNAEFAALQIENLTEREHYRFCPRIQLHFKTTPDQIRYILLNIKQSLIEHHKVIESPLRVNFSGFGEHSLDLDIHCYIDTVDISEFKNVSEELNLHIMDIIQSAGTRVAIPAGIEYHGREITDSTEVQQQAKQKVELYRESNKPPGN